MAIKEKPIPERFKGIEVRLEKYIKETQIPILAEFCASEGITRQFIYQFVECQDLIKLCAEKKEGALERTMYNVANWKIIPAVIFGLKQLGWSDKIETTDKTPLNISDPETPIEGSDNVEIKK